jgi:hypothetical protein
MLAMGLLVLVDALGKPAGFCLTGGEAHDLVGADHLLPAMQVDMLVADVALYLMRVFVICRASLRGLSRSRC